MSDVPFQPTLAVGLWPHSQRKGLATGCRVQELLDLEGRGAASVFGGGGGELPSNGLECYYSPSHDGHEVPVTI